MERLTICIMVDGGSVKDPLSVSTANEALHILNSRLIDTGPVISDKELWRQKLKQNEGIILAAC